VITRRLRGGRPGAHLYLLLFLTKLLRSHFTYQADLNVLGVETDERGGTWSVAFAYTESSWRVRE
jgi:hypothetical protein